MAVASRNGIRVNLEIIEEGQPSRADSTEEEETEEAEAEAEEASIEEAPVEEEV